MHNPDLDRLQPYPFQRLAELRRGTTANAGLAPIDLSIGEPRHDPPPDVMATLTQSMDGFARYPATRGEAALRETICTWLTERFGLSQGSLDPERHVLPVNGTREALFAVGQAVIDRGRRPAVLIPNPFYQIYEGAALLAGAEPHYLDCNATNGFMPDLDTVPEAVWQRCQLLYLCSPGNPTGAVADLDTLVRLLDLADRHDFVIASDECYSEIYSREDEPPPGLLQACARTGRDDFARCLAFHSLSKRSNLPGLRSGFVAGDARLIGHFLRYRTYHGCAMPPPVQQASMRAWSDERHVRDNRASYRTKFDEVMPVLDPVLDVSRPRATFYLWPRTPIADADFALRLYREYSVSVLPGSFLSRRIGDSDPGAGRIRVSLVASVADCVEAAERIRCLVEDL